jgi:acetyl esterase/lipase
VAGLQYREAVGDGEASTVDVYVPDSAEGRPAVVLLHGIDQNIDGKPDTPLDTFAQEIARLGATVFYFDWDTYLGWSSRTADDLSCVGTFVQAHAAEYGADPERVVIVGHSMGGNAGSNLAFRSFELTHDADCGAIGPNPRSVAFVGIGGSYGFLSRPVASQPGTFLVKGGSCNTPTREALASDEIAPGLTAEQGHELDGYSSVHLAPADLRVLLVIGSLDPFACTSLEVTNSFADVLRVAGIDVEVVEMEGRGHDDVVSPFAEAGKETLRAIAGLLGDLRSDD